MKTVPSLRDLLRKIWPGARSQPQFRRFARSYRERLRRWPPAPVSGLPGSRPGILITPWMETAVPFFSIECALALAERGLRPTLMVDCTDVFRNAAKAWEVEEILATLDGLSAVLDVVRVEETPPEPGADPVCLRTLVYENAVKKLRGEGGAEEFLAENRELDRQMHEHAGRVRRFLRGQSFAWLLIPGGVWAISGLYAAVARELGIDYTTYDAGASTLVLAHRGVATHLADVPPVLAELKRTASRAQRNRMSAIAHAQLRQRMAGDDELRLQPHASSPAATPRCDLLVPLNLRWDTAALSRQRLFASITDWLQRLLAWARLRPEVALVIRQHPCEKIPGFEGSDRFDRLVRELVDHGARFVAAHDPVNSYDLLRQAKVVLPFTSRIGIESIMLGKPVVLGSHCYYGECGLGWSADSIPHYFELIERGLAGGLVVGEPAREDAAFAYYLAEKCVFLPTPWTPQPEDFERWCATPPADLWHTPENSDLLDSLLRREPLTQIRCRRLEDSA